MNNLPGKEIETDFSERRCLDDTQICRQGSECLASFSLAWIAESQMES